MKHVVGQPEDFLQTILRSKRERLKFLQEATSLTDLQNAALSVRSVSIPHMLREQLLKNRLNVIAEFKRRSPSKGVIRLNADAVKLAESYQAAGAAAISVLTEEDHFAGSIQDLEAIKKAVDLPVLRKDFIVGSYQIFQSAAAGADAVLLIVAALDDSTLLELRELAEDKLGMDALVEVHNDVEMNRAIDCGATLIGVNNRNLHTFEVSLDVSVALAQNSNEQQILVSESGLRTHEDLQRLRKIGYRGFLVGEQLMRSEKPEETLKALIEG